GAVAASLVIAPILTLLHSSYGIGIAVREGVNPLTAPQATLFAKLAEFFFMDKGTLPMTMVVIGMIIAACAIIIDEILRKRKASFRVYVMAISIGIYLPLEVTAPMFIGGLLHYWVTHRVDADKASARTQKGILVASGLIAGESLMGILLAGAIFVGLPIPISAGSWVPSMGVSTLAYIAALIILSRVLKK
ncbi:MAG: OPT/YSL family transporter, partial [bacterium]|nr:OPT/YSL family transporter [bacterium]